MMFSFRVTVISIVKLTLVIHIAYSCILGEILITNKLLVLAEGLVDQRVDFFIFILFAIT